MPLGSHYPFDAKSRFGAHVSVDIENDKVFEEIVFAVSKRFPIASEGVVNIVIDPTACTCNDLVLLPLIFKAFGAGPINIDLYFGTDADDDGTLWPSFNRDNTSSEVSNLVVRLNPTINAVGTKLPPEFVINSDGIPAVASLGGEAKDNLITKARTDGKYMIRLTNTEANTATGYAGINWFEVE